MTTGYQRFGKVSSGHSDVFQHLEILSFIFQLNTITKQ